MSMAPTFQVWGQSRRMRVAVGSAAGVFAGGGQLLGAHGTVGLTDRMDRWR